MAGTEAPYQALRETRQENRQSWWLSSTGARISHQHNARVPKKPCCRLCRGYLVLVLLVLQGLMLPVLPMSHLQVL